MPGSCCSRPTAAGSGPSGRNGGFVNSMSFSLPTCGLLRRPSAPSRWSAPGTPRCRRSATGASSRGSMPGSATAAICRRRRAPNFDHAWDPSPIPARSSGSAAGIEILDRDAIRARCASPIFRAGAYYRAGATVQPARLAAGLRDRLLEAGVEIHEHTTVQSLTEEGEGSSPRPRAGTSAPAPRSSGGRLAAAFRPLRRSLT